MKVASVLSLASVALAVEWQNLYTPDESCKSDECSPYIGTGVKLEYPELYACLLSAQDCPFEADFFVPEAEAPEPGFLECTTTPGLFGADVSKMIQHLDRTDVGVVTPDPARLLLSFDTALPAGVEIEVKHGKWSSICTPEQHGAPRTDVLFDASAAAGSKSAYVDFPADATETGLWVQVTGEARPVKVVLDSKLVWKIDGFHTSDALATFASAALVTTLAATMAWLI